MNDWKTRSCFVFVTAIFLSSLITSAWALDPQPYFTDNTAATSTSTTITTMEQALLDLINAAGTSIDVSMYNFNRVSIKNALITAHGKPGVTVRVVTDDDGYNSPLYKSHFQDLESAGITVVLDNRSPIMHNKFFVFDYWDPTTTNTYVWTGSTNISDKGFSLNHNNSIVYQSHELGEYYNNEFLKMFYGDFGTTKSPSSFTNPIAYPSTDPTSRTVNTDLYFSPKDGALDAVKAAVLAATDSIYFSIFYFTDSELADLLIGKHQGGVTVQGVWDAFGADNYFSQDEYLCNAGVPIRLDDYSGLVHNKFMVIDEGGANPVVITGSMNWTSNGDGANDENTLIIHDQDVANAYLAAWNVLWSNIDPAEQCAPGVIPQDIVLDMTRSDPSVVFDFDYVLDTFAFHLYGVENEANMLAGNWDVKIGDLELNQLGTWDTDNVSYNRFTLTDGTLLPDANYIVVAENFAGEGHYGYQSDDTARTKDTDKIAPTCLGCIYTPSVQDLIINEFYADPAPDPDGDANNDGDFHVYDDEFIEIVNISTERMNLNGLSLWIDDTECHTWSFGDILDPCQSAVVFGGGTPTGTFGGAIVDTVSDYKFQMLNSGATISLKLDATVLDSYTYGSEAANDSSMVRNPEATYYAPFQETNVATASAYLFTPGVMNDGSEGCISGNCPLSSASIDTVSPGASVLPNTIITLIGSGTGENPLTYEWDFDYQGGVFTRDATGMNTSTSYSVNGIYKVAFRVSDSCADPGTQRTIDTVNILVTDTVISCSDITINELDPDASNENEFIELHNATGNTIDLFADGYIIVFFNGGTSSPGTAVSYKDFDVAPASAPIPSGGFYTVANDGASIAYDNDWGGTGLQNGPDAVGLYKSAPGFTCSSSDVTNGTAVSEISTECELVDYIAYEASSEWVPILNGQTDHILDPSGESINRTLDSQGCPMGIDGNWSNAAPSPGTNNGGCALLNASIDSVVPDPVTNNCTGTTFTFIGSGVGGEGAISLEWDFDYDGSNFTVDATGTVVQHSYSVDKAYTVALRVSDECSLGVQVATDTYALTIADCCAYATATIDTVSPALVVATGDSMSVTGTGTGQGTITHEWDFDWDGVPGNFTVDRTGAAVSYTYGSGGQYTVGYRVTDSCNDPTPQVVHDSIQVVVNTTSGTCADLTINEINCSPSDGEFVELHNDTGASINTSSGSYVLVFFNGGDTASYKNVELTGTVANDDFLLIGDGTVVPAPDIDWGSFSMQDGPEAVALYKGTTCSASDFPTDTPPAVNVNDCVLVDAVVYGTNDSDHTDLMTALWQTEQVNEASAADDSIQRITDSQGCLLGWKTPNWESTYPTIGISNESCPTASATIDDPTDPPTICLGDLLTFNGSGRGEGTLTYEWDFDYDGVPANFNAMATGASVDYTYPIDGSFTAGLRITDTCTQPNPQIVYDTVAITVNDCCTAITASIDTVSPSVTVCQGIQQSFSGSGTGEGALTYEWDFDYDGATFNVDATGQNANNTYGSTGSYEAALRVTDNCALGGPQSTITITPIIINGCGGNCPDITINEVDSDQASSDTAEFVELHNDTGAMVGLATDHYVLVFFNGGYAEKQSYHALDLTGNLADGNFHVAGNASVSPDDLFDDGKLQNGADAVALYRGANCAATEFSYTPAAKVVGKCALVDAIVYDTGQDDDLELMAALGVTEQINEDAGGSSETDSIQRITDSQGCPMGWETPNWEVSGATAGISNTSCPTASAAITAVTPSTIVCQGTQQSFSGVGTGEGTLTYEWDFDYDGVPANFVADATGQDVDYTYDVSYTGTTVTAALRVTDSCSNPTAQVEIATISITINDCCATISSSIDSIAPSAGECTGTEFTFTGSGTGEGSLTYQWDFNYNGSVFNVLGTGTTVNRTYASPGLYTVAFRVTDSCADPSPQSEISTTLIAVYSCGINCRDITINELDADQSGTDSNEFVELHNDTGGSVDLAAGGYVLVTFDGSDDASDGAWDLTGSMADNGFFVAGGDAVSPDLSLGATNVLANGADAIAIYRGPSCAAAEFPSNTPAAQSYPKCVLVDALVYDTNDTDDTDLMNALGVTEQINEDDQNNRYYHAIKRVTDSQGCPMGWPAPNWEVSGPTPGYANTDCTAPIASIESVYPDLAVCEGTQQTFTAFGFGETPLTFEWDFHYDGPGTFVAEATGQVVDYTYVAELGSHTVAVRLTDGCGSPQQIISETVTTTINDCCAWNTATITSVTPGPTVTQGTQQTFNGSGTGEGSLTLQWDFTYDGATFNVDATGTSVNNTYGSAGMYTVAFRVTDSCSDPAAQVAITTQPVVVNPSAASPCPDITINEIDPDLADGVEEEFVELHNDTGASIDLDAGNYVLVFFNGWDDDAYFSLGLTGTVADNGYYLIGNSAVTPTPDQIFADGELQNGVDAVALYRGENCSTADFPADTNAGITVGNCTLVDAVVYGDPLIFVDSGLLSALGQPDPSGQVNENANSLPETQSLQRITDSQGCPNNWAGNWKAATPSPDAAN